MKNTINRIRNWWNENSTGIKNGFAFGGLSYIYGTVGTDMARF